jgi:hypothetical protein
MDLMHIQPVQYDVQIYDELWHDKLSYFQFCDITLHLPLVILLITVSLVRHMEENEDQPFFGAWSDCVAIQ